MQLFFCLQEILLSFILIAGLDLFVTMVIRQGQDWISILFVMLVLSLQSSVLYSSLAISF